MRARNWKQQIPHDSERIKLSDKAEKTRQRVTWTIEGRVAIDLRVVNQLRRWYASEFVARRDG